MALIPGPITESEYTTVRRGLGVLPNVGVLTTGLDFDLTAWAGQLILVTCSGDALGAWSEVAATAITTTDQTTAQAVPSGAQLTNGFPIQAGIPTPMCVPRSTLAAPAVFLRLAGRTATVTAWIERT